MERVELENREKVVNRKHRESGKRRWSEKMESQNSEKCGEEASQIEKLCRSHFLKESMSVEIV